MAAPPTVQQLEPTALRDQLTDQLLADGRILSPAVEKAFRTVPRHAFAPEVPVEAAYADDVIPTRHAADGRTSSSISAPWLQANMLEAARLRPGDRVLEIGSGGYNAALIAEAVGETGSVTTLDIDPQVTDRAARCLTATGYDRVHVITADAENLPAEAVPDGGFDAVIVTVNTWDLPWIDLVADGGRLVAPLRLHQYTWSIGFTKQDGVLTSDGPLTTCSFVPMQGDGAWDSHRSTIPGRGIHLAFEDGTPLPVDELAPAFDARPATVRTHVTVRGQEPFDALPLYLSGALPGFCRLSADPDTTIISPPPPHWPGAAFVRGASLARLTTEKISEGDDGLGLYEFVVHGYGPAGHTGATEMAEQIQHWQRNHRAALFPQITVRPHAATPEPGSTPGLHVFTKKHTLVTIDWPVIPGTAALLTDDQGRYLLHLRDANKPIWRPGQWALLGGNTEKGEGCDEAIVRELAEETGLEIPDLTGFITLDTLDAGGDFKDRVRIYHGTLNRPAHEIDLHEGIQLRWTRMDETAHMTMDPGTLAVLQAHQDTPHPSRDSAGSLPTIQVREAADPRSRSIVGAHLVLLRDGAVLLGKRHPDSAFAPSAWHLPAGHREAFESAIACMIREAEEETGLALKEDDLSLVHTLDLRDHNSPIPRIQLFFTATRWDGEPAVLEPDCCTEWAWWPLATLPDPTVEYTRTALDAIARGVPYTAMGWA
ncbi:methyltransferase, FxLD system [Streptomyces sp. NPDC051561]|uniref:methyltransferase, FxLD system n=1 Tax=Streptomyces sp. NPDC051561 TaxID=3365658 RepID=UPI00379D1F84